MADRDPSCEKVRPDHSLNALLINDDHSLTGGELTGRESKPFKGDRTNKKLVKVQKAEISLILNTFKRELHPR